jgi:hypothetical protein
MCSHISGGGIISHLLVLTELCLCALFIVLQVAAAAVELGLGTAHRLSLEQLLKGGEHTRVLLQHVLSSITSPELEVMRVAARQAGVRLHYSVTPLLLCYAMCQAY